MKITSTLTKLFCDLCSRKAKTKLYQISCTSCQAIIHKICTNLNDEKYREIKKQRFSFKVYVKPNTFPFSEQSNSNISLINCGFNNFIFSKDINKNCFFTECISIETPFKDSDHPLSIDSKYFDINDFNKLKQKSLFCNSPS